MRYHRYISMPTLVLAIVMIFVSCQETPEIVAEDQEDTKIMQTALDQAEEYVDELEANVPEESRSSWSRPDVVCIVYKYENGEDGGKLLYNAWDDRKQGYVEVTEEEVTAIVKPNTIICHFRGRGLQALNAIEFDGPSRAILGRRNNYQYWRNYWWVTFVPPNVQEDVILKYDIVYDARNDGEGPIRLDPKVVIPSR